jgi:hypothetical protein
VAQLIGWLNLVIEKKSRSKLMRQHLRIYSNSDIVAKTPPLLKVVELALLLQHLLAIGNHATPDSVNVSTQKIHTYHLPPS